MPSAMLTACPHLGCPELTEGGPCPEHARQRERFRGTASIRGYDSEWTRFRRRFFDILIAAGFLPACGAALPGGPSMKDSRCAAAGLVNTVQLELDHDPPLTAAERNHRTACVLPQCGGKSGHSAFLCANRVGLYCRSCHSRKTLREQQGGRATTSDKATVTLVYGPPGAGKSRFVEEQARHGDIVMDVDRLVWALTLGASEHQIVDPVVVGLAVVARDAMLDTLRRSTHPTRVWLIACAPTAHEREVLTRGFDAAHRHHVSASLVVCQQRCAEREGGAAHWDPIVADWFARVEG